MSIFSNILGKILGHSPAATQSTPVAASTPVPGSTPPIGGVASAAATPAPAGDTTPAVNAPAAPVASAPAAPTQPVDVSAILKDLAAQNPEKLDWKTSIVDMLKLLGMDSSLSARKELAKELNYTGDTSDSASMNIWLHKEVMNKIAANGGKVPAELLS